MKPKEDFAGGNYLIWDPHVEGGKVGKEDSFRQSKQHMQEPDW